MTRAQQVGLRLEDMPRSSLAKLTRQHQLDAPREAKPAIKKATKKGGQAAMPRRYELAPRSSACYRCGRRLTAKTSKLLRTIYRAHLRTCRRAGDSA